MSGDIIRAAILAPILAMRVGLRTLIDEDDGVEVDVEASNFGDLREDLNRVDILLIQGDFSAEDIKPTQNLGSQLAYIWMTDDPQAADVLRSLSIRAWGIVSLDATEDELLTALLAVYHGNIVAPKEMLETLFRNQRPSQSGNMLDTLTPRENEFLQLLAQGLANKQIALELEISEHTVKFHISSIYSKIGATNRTEAVRSGLQLGIISL